MPDPQVPERATRRTYPAKYKLGVLAEYEAADRAGKGASLRCEGLYTSLIAEWRKQRDRGGLAGLSATRDPKPTDPTARENERLRAESARLAGELDTARTVVRVQGDCPCSWSSSHSRAWATPTASCRDDRHRGRVAGCVGWGEGGLRCGRAATSVAVPR